MDGALSGWLVGGGPLLDQVPAAGRVPLLLLVVTLAVWAVLDLAVTIATRPASVRPGPATQELGGDEPPAIVNVLVAGWKVTEDAAAATVVDLAARGHLEFRQPSPGPLHTTVQVTEADAPLTAYERQLLDHVRIATEGGSVPLGALTFHGQGRAAPWTDRFACSVLEDAWQRGLVRRRVPWWAVAMLGLVALLPGAALAWFSWELAHNVGWMVAGLGLPGALVVRSARRGGLNGTAKGQEVAARWLGLQTGLRADPAFAALPPSAVEVWGRHLAYGNALGVTHVVRAVIRLGTAGRPLVWSSYGGRWRQVRVRYPRARLRYGSPAYALLATGLLAGAFGSGVLGAWLLIVSPHLAELPMLRAWPWAPLVIGGPPAVYGAYTVLRTLADLLLTRTLTGQVLWVDPWRTRTSNGKAEIVTHYLAVDDGTRDVTTSWALPNNVTRGFGVGSVVEITVRPWSRRILALQVVR